LVNLQLDFTQSELPVYKNGDLKEELRQRLEQIETPFTSQILLIYFGFQFMVELELEWLNLFVIMIC
jgi:uncharacterized membrane protein (DUF485 family)